MTFSKIISLFTFLFFINTISFGQYFGVKSGINFPSFAVDKEDFGKINHSPEGVNLHFSVFYEQQINGHFTLMPALKYSIKKMEYAEEFSSISEYRLAYFEVPLLVKAYLKPKSEVEERLRLYAIAGPYFAFGTKGDFIRAVVYPRSVWQNGKDENRLKRTNYGVTYGVGFEKKAVQVEVFHSIGIPNIANSFDGLSSGKLQNIGVSVALLFLRERNDY